MYPPTHKITKTQSENTCILNIQINYELTNVLIKTLKYKEEIEESVHGRK